MVGVLSVLHIAIFQVWEEYDEEVQDAEAAEQKGLRGDITVEKDSELKPFVGR